MGSACVTRVTYNHWVATATTERQQGRAFLSIRPSVVQCEGRSDTLPAIL